MKNNTKLLLWAAIAALMLAVLAILLFGGERVETVTGRLVIEVVDGGTERPIEGCTVVVVEDNVTALTDETGCTEEIEVSVNRNARYDDILPQDWGETTLIIYKEGYIPYALFHAQVKANETRNGPRIYLFEDDGSMRGKAFSVIEGPERDWVNALVEKFAPGGTTDGESTPAP